jgi:purine nucleosidase
MDYRYPPEKLKRVIVNTDAKNEADDQYAIVQAILSKSFELHGIIAAHFGVRPDRAPDTLQASLDEVNLLLKLMNLTGKVRVEAGAPKALVDEKTPQPSAGARLIVDEAMKDDPRTLHVLFYGPLTDMASALLMEPRLAERNVHVVWIGGGMVRPLGKIEFNLSNDIHAANVIMKSKLAVSQVPYPMYQHVNVGYAELIERVYPHGAIGRYLVEQLFKWNERNKEAQEHRALGDSPAVGIVIAPNAGRWSWVPAPEYHPISGDPFLSGQNRPIKLYETYDMRFLMEDFYAKLAQFARSQEAAK